MLKYVNELRQWTLRLSFADELNRFRTRKLLRIGNKYLAINSGQLLSGSDRQNNIDKILCLHANLVDVSCEDDNLKSYLSILDSIKVCM